MESVFLSFYDNHFMTIISLCSHYEKSRNEKMRSKEITI